MTDTKEEAMDEYGGMTLTETFARLRVFGLLREQALADLAAEQRVAKTNAVSGEWHGTELVAAWRVAQAPPSPPNRAQRRAAARNRKDHHAPQSSARA